jgi:TolB protein
MRASGGNLRRVIGLLCWAMAAMSATIPTHAQRRPVLPQIDEPHPYYYRELYLPQLTSGPSSLTWGPNSQELIYSMAGSLWRQTLGTRDAKQLTDGPGYDYEPDWSPDGTLVVYVSYQKDAMELWLLDLPSGKSTQLTQGGAVNVEPRWSPDGKRLAWVSTQFHGRFHIFLADFKNGALGNVTKLTGETKSSLPRYYYSEYDMEINPVWTRDGKEILFVSNKGHIYGTGGFWRMKAEPGAAAREIHYEETSWKARPEFSPDGSRMVYSSYLGRQWHQLWVMPAEGGDAFPISYGDWDDTFVRWSPDGKKIAAVSNESGTTEIFWRTIPGTNRHPLQIEGRKYLRARSTLKLRMERTAADQTAARVSITDSSGTFFAPSDTEVFADDGFDRGERPSERHYFYAKKTETEIQVPPGKYLVEVSRGLSEKPVRAAVEVRPEEDAKVDVKLQPLMFEPTDGKWISADFHVHMNYGGTYRNSEPGLATMGRAEGLDVIHELIVNKEQRFPDIEFAAEGWTCPSGPATTVVRGQEFHTSYWGHRGVLNLSDHLLLPGYAGYPNTATASLYPMNADVYDKAHDQGALVGAVHPFDDLPDPFAKPAQKITDELPVDVALGKLDYMEIVGFSDHKSTAAVWYKLLNLGFRLPAAGGTDATTDYAAPIRGQVGFDRVYIRIPEWPAPTEMWKDGLLKGRTFATNGPLVNFQLGGEMVGEELKFTSPPTAVPFTAKMRSIVPVDHLEVVCNGKVVRDLKLSSTRDSADVGGTLPLNESGWCVLRAWSEKDEYPVMDKYVYATTSPIYVTVGGERAYSKEDAEYFKAWIDRTIEVTGKYPDWNSAEEKQYVMKKLRDARAVYEGMR